MKILLTVILLAVFSLASDPPPQAPKAGDFTVAPADTDTMTQADRDGIQLINLMQDENEALTQLARDLNLIHMCALKAGDKLTAASYEKCESKFSKELDMLTDELTKINKLEEEVSKRLGLDK